MMGVLTSPIRKTSSWVTLLSLALSRPRSAAWTSSAWKSLGSAWSPVCGPGVSCPGVEPVVPACGCEGAPRDTVTRRLAHEPLG